MREDGVPVEELQLGHRLIPQLGIKLHRDNGHLLQGEDDEVGLLQTRNRQLNLDLCIVAVGCLQDINWRLEIHKETREDR